MISLLHSCTLLVDNGDYCSDGCWHNNYEYEQFIAGEEIDETDPKIDTSNITEGEDFLRID
jgi:hypothetical protein